MEDKLIEILESLKYPVYRQGSVSVYPPAFFTFWNYDTPDHAYYDNNPYGTAWNFGVYFYAEDPSLTYSVVDAARTALRAAGWIVPSRVFDATSDEPTHTGRGLNVYYLETTQEV